jgi:hypothetical protein
MKDEARIVSTALCYTNGCRWKCVIGRHDTNNELSKKCEGFALHMG